VKKVAGAVRATATSNPGGHGPAETMQVTIPAAPPQPARGAAAAPGLAAAPADQLVPITAPMVGTFYRATNPDAPPFVAEGDAIEPGQTVCIIEAMKLFNEIQSEVRGRVVRILVENGAPVEFGQPLFLVDTAAS